MLGRLGLQFTHGSDVRNERQVNENRVLATFVLPDLADSLQERQAFDVTDRSSDFRDDDVVPGCQFPEAVLDFIRDVGNNLNRRPQIVPPSLFRDHVLIDAPCADAVALRERFVGKTFVVSEVQISLGTVVGHVDFAVLKR